MGFSPAHERAWADGVAIYNTLSGETHILDPLAREVLALLLGEEREESKIISDLTLTAGEDLPELPDAVRALLQEMDRLGLVEVAP